jgi:hypothetical protein
MRWKQAGAIAIAMSLALGCGKKKPPEPPPEPTVEPEPPPPPPAPPPPKCETIEEDCVAKESTKARIPSTHLVFAPVKGWKYAQTPEGTIVQPFEIGSALAMTTFEVDAKKDKESRDAALEALAKTLTITFPKKPKINWAKPDPANKKKIGELEINLWQVETVKRGDRKGPLLIVSAALPDHRALLGIGFVPDDDKTGADEQIMGAVDSIKPGEEAGGKK